MTPDHHQKGVIEMSLGPPSKDSPGLFRLQAAAAMAGMSSPTFEAAVKTGVIPVEIIRTTPRMAYVRATELNAFLKGKSHD